MVILIHGNKEMPRLQNGYRAFPSDMQEIKTWMTSGDNVIESEAPETKRSREEYYIICTIVEMSVWYAVDKWSIVATKEAIVWLTKHSWNKKEYPGGPVSLPDTRLAHPTGKVMTCSNEYHYIAFKHGQDCAWSLCGTPEALRHEYAG